MEEGLNFDRKPIEFTLGPINVWVEGAEPQVSKDHSISSKVSDIKAFGVFLCSTGYKEVEVVGNLLRFVKSSINVS
jgi:hypothetical protein